MASFEAHYSQGVPSAPPPHLNPMTTVEVAELLGATLHGSLPDETVQRMMATLADWMPVVLAAKAAAKASILKVGDS